VVEKTSLASGTKPSCGISKSEASLAQVKPTTMKTFFIAILCLTVGTAYGQYFIDAIQAGTDLVETARQS
jgi:hypothetical protein